MIFFLPTHRMMDSSKVVPVDHDGIHTQSKSQDKNNSGHEHTLNITDLERAPL